MEIFTDIPVHYDIPALLEQNHIAVDSDDASSFSAIGGRQPMKLPGPRRFLPKRLFEELGTDTVCIGGITFTSRMLRRNLEGAERVYPFVATCGQELDTVALPEEEFLAPFWWDSIKEASLWCAARYLSAAFDERYPQMKTSAMSPGSGDADVWPIGQQQELFYLLGGVTPDIGVRLSASCLMSPNKSISGIRFPATEEFHTCQVCQRSNCPNRNAPFDEALWRIKQGIEV